MSTLVNGTYSAVSELFGIARRYCALIYGATILGFAIAVVIVR